LARGLGKTPEYGIKVGPSPKLVRLATGTTAGRTPARIVPSHLWR